MCIKTNTPSPYALIFIVPLSYRLQSLSGLVHVQVACSKWTSFALARVPKLVTRDIRRGRGDWPAGSGLVYSWGTGQLGELGNESRGGGIQVLEIGLCSV